MAGAKLPPLCFYIFYFPVAMKGAMAPATL